MLPSFTRFQLAPLKFSGLSPVSSHAGWRKAWNLLYGARTATPAEEPAKETEGWPIRCIRWAARRICSKRYCSTSRPLWEQALLRLEEFGYEVTERVAVTYKPGQELRQDGHRIVFGQDTSVFRGSSAHC